MNRHDIAVLSIKILGLYFIVSIAGTISEFAQAWPQITSASIPTIVATVAGLAIVPVPEFYSGGTRAISLHAFSRKVRRNPL